MHEIAVATALMKTVADAAGRAGAGRVTRVFVQLGELSCLDPDALRFAYTAASAGLPLLAGSRLEVAWVPIRVACDRCGREGPAVPRTVVCAHCRNPHTRVVGGEELMVTEIEVERDAEPGAGPAERPVPQR